VHDLCRPRQVEPCAAGLQRHEQQRRGVGVLLEAGDHGITCAAGDPTVQERHIGEIERALGRIRAELELAKVAWLEAATAEGKQLESKG
jgi:hypothetical protein